VLVCDASLAVELCLDRVGERADEALGDEELVAPPLLWSEAPSVLSEMAFRATISRSLADQGLGRFLDGRIAITERTLRPQRKPAGAAHPCGSAASPI